MKYLLVRWSHEDIDEPILLYSELDDDRYEMRKVEIFKDGRVGIAREGMECGSTLGLYPISPIQEIAASPEFLPQEINPDEFEAIWQIALQLTGSVT